MSRFVDANEVLLLQARKSRFQIFAMIIFLPIWLYFGYFLMSPCYRRIFLGDTTLNREECLIAGLIVLVLFLPVVLLIVLSYFLNRLIITDQRIYIRRGIIGRTQIIHQSDVRSFQHVFSRSSKGSNHSILFYLRCGIKIKTGELFTTLFGLQDLLALLRDKFEGRGFTNQELKEMKLQSPEGCQVVTKRNVFVLVLMFAPFILALALTGLYLSGTF